MSVTLYYAHFTERRYFKVTRKYAVHSRRLKVETSTLDTIYFLKKDGRVTEDKAKAWKTPNYSALIALAKEVESRGIAVHNRILSQAFAISSESAPVGYESDEFLDLLKDATER